MIFAISAILLASNIISQTPLIGLTPSSEDAFCKVGACFNAHRADKTWAPQVVRSINTFCSSNLATDANANAACTILTSKIIGNLQPTSADINSVSLKLKAFAVAYNSALTSQYGGVIAIMSHPVGKFCWGYGGDMNYANFAACAY